MNRVKGYRMLLGWSQKDLANFLGISRQTVSNKETGKVPFNDKEKKKLLTKFKEVNPNVTMEIFFK